MPTISDETLNEVEKARAKWDAEFSDLIRRSRKGERNLQLAAAAAAGAEVALRRLYTHLRAERR